MKKIFIIQVFDSMASNHGEWENESAALTLEEAKEEQAKLAKRGYKTHVTSLKLVSKEDN